MIGAVLFATVAVASGPGAHDLTNLGDTEDLNDGAVIQQSFAGVVGTGSLSSFVRVQAVGTEDGYNTSDRQPGSDKILWGTGDPGGVTDDTTDPNFTIDLPLNLVPVVSFEGGLYREFRLDLNEPIGGGPDESLISLDDVQVWIGADDNINFFDRADGSYLAYPGGVAGQATPVWELEDGWYVVLDADLSQGSGNSGDARLLVPISSFGGAQETCPYNPAASNCGLFVYFTTTFGVVQPGGGTFEEWSVRRVPYVTKTVETAITRTFGWTITKSVDPDSHHLFDGDNADSTYTVSVLKDDGTDSGWEVSGTISITNPQGAADATITGVTDVISGGLPDVNAVVTCPGVFPQVLNDGDVLECDYVASSGSATSNPFGDTNTATVAFTVGGNADTAAVQEDVDFSTPTITEVNGTVDVTDSFEGGTETALGTGITDDTTFTTYDRNFDCDDVTFAEGATTSDTVNYEDIARVKVGTTVLAFDTADVDVTCYRPTIVKTANTAFTRTFGWTIEKSVVPDAHHLFDGDNDDSTYTVSVLKDDGTPSARSVTGSITVLNPHPTDSMTVTLSDALDDGTVASITGCTGTGVTFVDATDVLTVTAGNTAVCSYSASPSGALATKNTASFSLFAIPYSDDAIVDWSAATVTPVNGTVDVTDGFEGGTETALGTGITDDTTFNTYDRNFDCADVTFAEGATTSDTVNYEDIARVKVGTTVLAFDTADVDVTCYRPTIVKTANTALTREWNWNISKSRVITAGEDDGDGDPLTLTLDEGQTYTAHYEVTVSLDGLPTDSAHSVTGSITVFNPHISDSMTVTLSDVLDDGTAVSITGCTGTGVTFVDATDLLTVTAGNTAVCSYSASPSGALATKNTASFSLFAISYSDDATVDWSAATITKVDECVTVSDNKLDPALNPIGTVCAEEDGDPATFTAPHTFSYDLVIGPFAVCGQYTFTNRATYLTVDDANDTGETDFAEYTVNIDVPCPQGCTLTQGYWKTHNETFKGGAPPDPTWFLLGDVDGDTISEGEGETFFLSGMTYFEVMWTPAQGNAYFILAKQYIAAHLNQLDGADGSVIATAFAQATTLFQTWTDEEIALLKGKNGKELRAQFISLAGILGSYNEGLIGPGHCDEDATTVQGLDMVLLLGAAEILRRRGRHSHKR